MMKNTITNALIILIFILGLCILMYPTVSNFVNTQHNARVIAEYESMVATITEKDYGEYLEKAREYNRLLAAKSPELENMDYNSILSINPSGIMGYLEIPKMNTRLAIYHGVDQSVLQVGIGHLPESSLPVGGKDGEEESGGVHAVLSGHRGLPSAKLLTDLDVLIVGDIFYVYILDELFAYQVDDIRVVEPKDVSSLAIVPGEEYVTLVTCTPYGINSHRLLVRGSRVEYKKTLAKKRLYEANAKVIDPNIVASVICCVILTIIFILTMIYRHRKNKRLRKEKENASENN